MKRLGNHRQLSGVINCLRQAAGGVVTAEAIGEWLYGDDPTGGPLFALRGIYVVVHKLRKMGFPITTLHGRGYMFAPTLWEILVNDLEHDLGASPEILKKVQDREYALHLYAAMCNLKWRKDGDKGEAWAVSWRYSGGIVSDLRGLGESYLDFYCSGGEGRVAPDVAADLIQLGWKAEPWPDLSIQQEGG